MVVGAGVGSHAVSAQGGPPIEMTALDDLNMSPEQAMWMSGHATDISADDIQTFRFGDDPTGTPTLDVADSPWLTPVRLGAGLVEWGPDTLPVAPGEGVQPNGDIWATIGGGPKPDTTYLLEWAELDGPVPGPDGLDLWQNLAFPTSLHDHEGWSAQGPYIADTWQQGAFTPVLTYGPDPWSFQVQETADGNLVDRNDMSGFAYVGDTTLVMAFEAGPVLGDSPAEMLPWMGVGFAAHSHDGNFGAMPDSISRVTAWPGDLGPRTDALPPVPEGSDRILRVGFDPRVDPVDVWGVVDDNDGLWLDTRFAAPFGTQPPDDLFSVFVSFQVGMPGETGSSAGGWSLHDGVVETTFDVPGATQPPTPEMHVAGDGSILWNTGLMVDDAFHGDPMAPLTVESGFWPDEATTQARFATTMFELSAADLVHEDPLTHGGPPTWDLIGGLPVEAADNTIPPETSPTARPSTSESKSGGVTVTENPAGTSNAQDGDDGGGESDSALDGGVSTAALVVAAIVVGILVLAVIMLTRKRVRPFKRTVPGGDGNRADPGDDTVADDTGTTADDTSADDTSSDDTGTSTGVTTTSNGVDYFGKRDGDRPKRDCSELVAECRRLTHLADISDRQVEEAGERIDDLVAKLQEANSLHSRLEQRLADIVDRDNAPNQFERMAELQADIRRADQRVRDITRDKQTAEETLEAVKKEAEASRAEAKKACKAAADCEAGNG